MAGDASRLNGKKGGRPKGFAALEAERQRDYVAEKLVTEFAPIVDKAIEQAKAGDKSARDWITDRAYGKAQQFIDHTTDGGALGSTYDQLSNEELEAILGEKTSA
jgi:hypothetical protein